jgi:hypothetical protein
MTFRCTSDFVSNPPPPPDKSRMYGEKSMRGEKETGVSTFTAAKPVWSKRFKWRHKMEGRASKDSFFVPAKNPSEGARGRGYFVSITMRALDLSKSKFDVPS